MPTAEVIVYNGPIRSVARAFIDTGSCQTIITRTLARGLGLRLIPESTRLITLGGAPRARCSFRTIFQIEHRGDPPMITVHALVMDHIVPPMPNRNVRVKWPHLLKLSLADTFFDRRRGISMLLGSDILPHILKGGRVPPTATAPGAFNTSLGWVLYGPYRPTPPRCRTVRFAPEPQDRPSLRRPAASRNRSRHCSASRPSPATAPADVPVSDRTPLCTLAPTVEPLPPSSAAIQLPHSPPLISASPEPPDSPISLPRSRSEVDAQLIPLVRQFWELEQVPDRLPYTVDETQCEAIYSAAVYREKTGRYVVPLPLTATELGTSRNVATRQFLRMEKRLLRDSPLRNAYLDFMRDYLESGHMSLVTPQDSTPPYTPYFIPHHAVHRSDDPPEKIRVVFNASCSSANGKSLNDILLTGPKLQADIATLLLQFRLHAIVFTADIRQMYRQILVRPQERDFQRIIWRFSPEDPLSEYRLNTVTYGVSSAPYLALRTIRQLAIDEGDTYPLAKTALLNEVYVDDLLTGAATVDDAKILRNQLQQALMAGGFELRKWASNRSELLENIPLDHCRLPSADDPVCLDRDPTLKVLGLGWNPASDCFYYSVKVTEAAHTKRSVLSQMARIFDPLGWLTPVVFQAKLFFRHLCQLSLKWDQPLPDALIDPWLEFQSHLPDLAELQISRYVPAKLSTATYRLVGFCDASESGYAAVIYLHISRAHGSHSVHLLIAKSKVAPMKVVSLPRLELCGAHLLAKLLNVVSTRMIPHLTAEIVAFCDSTVALSWIKGESHRWKTFVGNRVASIQEMVPHQAWRHVRSEDNPADCASRGVSPHLIDNHPLWWSGPVWLSTTPDKWPSFSAAAEQSLVDIESRPSILPVCAFTPAEPHFTERFSSLLRLKRSVSYCLRFAHNCKSPEAPRRGTLSSVELQTALLAIVKSVQARELAREIQEAANPESRHRLVHQLRLFLDADGLVRVGGRLSAAPLPYGFRHPILLPKQSHLTRLIIDDAHFRLLHAGALATHSYIRRQFWILDGYNTTRRRIGRCNRCFSVKPRPIVQPLGNLPAERISATAAFRTVGVDYAGPIAISSARLRGAVTTKGYLVIFICFATKAVHIEVASDLTTSAFLGALRRFTARRGLPATIFSDNGTNFIGAHNRLRELGKLLHTPAVQTAIINRAAAVGIDWRFIPPSSPHFGGLWESAVKSAKQHLTRVIGEQRLTYEELLTVMTDIEAILNSRPLYAPSSDTSDLEPLTPGHFLVFRPLTAPPEADITATPLNRLSRWQLTQRIQQDFWKRWRQEYLHHLQQRARWLLPSTPVTPGTVVLIKDDQLPPRQWKLGRIGQLFPGRDGIVRVADVSTSAGVIRRSLAKLCPLPSQ